ncbi:Ig-like domain-containing protein [Cellulosimicrobium funkei]|uniref:Ig-like domain-containing protein n=1 Tax=Cellulosimicrobium funkei TaxID=264251 RepID=UPI00369272D2
MGNASTFAVEEHSQTFIPGPQASFAVPDDAESVQVVVAGAQGSTRVLGMPGLGGAGGLAMLDLGTDYNGQTFDILVGAPTGTVGAGGAFLALDGELFAVAGGGGSGSRLQGGALTPLPGGTAGFASGSLDGTDGSQLRPTYHHSGLGAVGASPGANGYTTGETTGFEPNGTTAVVVDGVIHPGLPSVRADSPQQGLGGQGYAGGGSGRDQFIAAERGSVRAAGGGASSYLAPGVVPVATGANWSDTSTQTAYVTFTWVTDDAPSGLEALDDQAVVVRDGSGRIDVLSNDLIPEGSTVTVTGPDAGPSNGQVLVEEDGTVTYTPNLGFLGTDTFAYTITDQNGNVSTGTVTVTVVEETEGIPLLASDAAVATGLVALAGLGWRRRARSA